MMNIRKVLIIDSKEFGTNSLTLSNIPGSIRDVTGFNAIVVKVSGEKWSVILKDSHGDIREWL